jgi:hypothetical protein
MNDPQEGEKGRMGEWEKGLRFIHICIFVNNNEGFRGCINKTDFP